MSESLFQGIPVAAQALLKAVSAVAEQQGVELYIVGGFVRDLKLDRSSTDYDLVVVGDAIKLAKAVRKRYGGDLLPHSRFGTANWTIGTAKDKVLEALKEFADETLFPSELPELLDFVTTRSETYASPAALPVVQPDDIQTDLARRDFTVNTFALPLSGKDDDVLSVPDAQQDLNEGLIRVLHDESFIDDPTRVFRAVRYEQRLGFSIEIHTLELLTAALPYIAELSGARVRHELNHILLEAERVSILGRLDDLAVLSNVDAGLQWSKEVQSSFSRLPERLKDVDIAYVAWLAHFPADVVERIAERLQFPTELAEACVAASNLKNDLPEFVGATPSTAVARLEDVSELALHAMEYLLEDDSQKELVARYLNKWVDIKAGTNGHKLKERGLEPGPRYKEILTSLRSAWLDGEVSTPEEEQVLLEQLLND